RRNMCRCGSRVAFDDDLFYKPELTLIKGMKSPPVQQVVADEMVKQAQSEARAEAERVLEKNKELLTKLKARIEGKLNDAIQFTIDVLLGKKEII
ncbi:MAG: hypothetical protein QXQ99_00745, partial [Nitrososphaerota archaeon]